ncbi:hypothetical protein [Prauserella cavernicola]|uniref:LPXTG cell wall anchor domain-containing protein n=1 Tax=Prauserella cavernicola TaxID=2800127 RepID=A0A934QUM2_9PSEU|nr:hypothetical protein [Prauserella cavernicola]MBK1786572.1 hypothetical protein [Prauserella cavernicola]
MSRFVTTLVVCGAVLVAAAPGVALGQEPPDAVDENSGPVAFANVASMRIDGDGQSGAGGSVITETQRSPLLPGTSTLAQTRSALPATDGEREAAGPNYLLGFGADSEVPEGVSPREHAVTATLRDTTVPTATAEATFALNDLSSDTPVVAVEGARSTVECATPDAPRAETTAERLLLLDENGELSPVEPPSGDEPVTRTGLRFGAPIEVEGADPGKTVSDVVLSKVSSFDQLVRQDQWRDGDVTTAAGWQVEIVSHVKDAEGADLREVTTRFVLGGVSCSLPAGFEAVTPGGGEQEPARPQVPVKIPAGVQAAPSSSAEPLGWALVGGGVVLGAAALLLVTRRRQAGSAADDA